MTRFRFLAVLMVVFSLVGCAGLTPTQQRTLTGGALGAAAGAGVAAIAGGSPLVGAAIGGTGGAVTGYAISKARR